MDPPSHQAKEGVKFQELSIPLIPQMGNNGEVVPEDWVERILGVMYSHPKLDSPHCIGGMVVLLLVDTSSDGEPLPLKQSVILGQFLLLK